MNPNAAKRAAERDAEARKAAFERLIFFSDAVFAIAITLLALDLVRGFEASVEQHATGTLAEHLYGLRGLVTAFVISFGVIGLFWSGHHRVFRSIGDVDYLLILINLVYLMFIVLIPFASFLWGMHLSLSYEQGQEDSRKLAVGQYSAILALAGLGLFCLWLYAAGTGRLAFEHRVRTHGRYYNLRLAFTPVAFLLPLALSFWNGFVACISLAVIGIVNAVIGRALLRWFRRR